MSGLARALPDGWQKLRYRTVPVDSREAVDGAWLALGDPLAEGMVLASGERLIAAAGVAARACFPCGLAEPGRAAGILDDLRAIPGQDDMRVPGSGPVLLGALPFDREEPCSLLLPAVAYGRDSHGRAWVTRVSDTGADLEGGWAPDQIREMLGSEGPVPHGDSRGVESAVSVLEHPTADQFVSMVGRALDRLAAHEIQKVVLARSVSVTTASPAIPYRVYHRFSQAEPSAFAFGRTSSTGAFIGASPELLVSRMGTRVLSEPLAGTVELDPADPAATDRTTALEASPKERSEHNLVVESVAGVLAAVCESLQVPDAPRIRRLSSLAHLATPISGHLSAGFAGTGALELAASLHPTPAVAGSPRDRALELIRELEGDLRGLYAGPVGWMDARGDGEFAVAIRSVALRASLAYACAGAGIVAGSDPGRELAETAAKLRPALYALGIEH